jgi:hypothetical protein
MIMRRLHALLPAAATRKLAGVPQDDVRSNTHAHFDTSENKRAGEPASAATCAR